MADPRIELAFKERLASLTPAWAQVWDDDSYDPVDGTPYLMIGFVSSVLNGSRLLGQKSEWTGTLQISIRATNKPTALSMQGALIAHFPKGLALTKSGLRLVCEQGSPFGGYADAGRWVIPYRIAFFTDPIV